MKTCTRIIAVTVLLTLCGLHWSNPILFSQPRGGARGGQRRAGGPGMGGGRFRTAEFDTASFDITRQQLPPVYLGHNVQPIYDAINDRKTEGTNLTETGARNPGNASHAIYLPLTGTLNFDSVYAFQIVPAENSYSAREQTIQSYCPLSTVLAEGMEDKTRKGFRIAYSPQMDTHYTYTDAKGRQIEVEDVKFRDYTIAFENFGQFPLEKAVLPSAKQEAEKGHRQGDTTSRSDDASEHEMIIGRFTLPPAEAEQFEESLRLLAVCRMVDPYVTSETVHRTGTPEKPGEYLAQHKYLHVRLLELWFYDIATGKVLMKIKPTPTG
jgi:hypothetical protein